jgi:hypothetical protein
MTDEERILKHILDPRAKWHPMPGKAMIYAGEALAHITGARWDDILRARLAIGELAFDLARDQRPFPEEALMEAADGAIYLAAHVLQRRDKR